VCRFERARSFAEESIVGLHTQAFASAARTRRRRNTVMDGPLVAHAAAGPNVPIRFGSVWFGAQFARDRALRRGEQERIVELRSNRRCPNTTQEYLKRSLLWPYSTILAQTNASKRQSRRMTVATRHARSQALQRLGKRSTVRSTASAVAVWRGAVCGGMWRGVA
jgi:hypothetical protein